MEQPFSFSKPKSSTDKKQSGISAMVEKIGAIVGLLESLGGVGVQSKTQKPLTKKEKNRIARILIIGILWFFGAGLYETIHLIINLINYIF